MREQNLTKRLTALLLALSMLAGLLAGCGGQTPESTEASPDAVTEPLRWTNHLSSNIMKSQEEAKGLHALTTRAYGDTQEKDYTIMVYMIGSDLESESGCATSDIYEMLDSGLDTSKCNLVLYTGGSKSWECGIASESNTVWAMDSAGDLQAVAGTEQPANMGDASTFLDFLCYAYNNYPAGHYGLICWDHGGGPLFGYGSDELFDGDGLYLEEMRSALEVSPFAEEKLDFIGFDACLMASLEVATVFADYAEYMVASEEVESGSGWDYSFLSILNDTFDTEKIAKCILDTYAASMEASFWQPDYTLSCVNLQRATNVNSFLGTLLYRMSQDLNYGAFSSIASTRDSTKRFGMSAISDRGSSYDLIDVGNLAENTMEDYGATSEDLLHWVDQAVVYEVSNVENTHGLSMYFPYDNKTLFQYYGDMFYELYEDCTGYQEFMDAYAAAWFSGRSSISWSPEQKLEAENEYLKLTLDEAQRNEVSSITYSILNYDQENETYSAVLTNCKADADENGVVRIPRDPDVFLMITDVDDALGQTGTLWPVMRMETNGSRRSYVSVNSQLMTSGDVIVGGLEYVQISLTSDSSSSETVIQSILRRDDESTAAFLGKQDVDIANWGIVSYMWRPLYPTYDMDGNMLPWGQWETDGSYWYSLCSYNEAFRMDTVKLSETSGTYYCQVVMADAAGNVIGTRLEPLQQTDSYKTQTVSTTSGDMIFHIYEDHATLHDFIEKDGLEGAYAVTVPETAGGVNVTVIGPDAFNVCWNLEQVTLPETITEISYGAFSLCNALTAINLPAGLKILGDSTFSNTGLTEITLPEGLEYIGSSCFSYSALTGIALPASVKLVGDYAFAGCSALTAITVAPGSTSFKSIDGVLYSADGKTLVSYAGGKSGSYTVPAGTEVIGCGAFRDMKQLTGITFPEGLKVIDRVAFCNTAGLTSIDLPDSLETIGSGAFSGSISMFMSENKFAVSIGKNVNYIGADAFSCYPVTEFRVDENNEAYASANACLLNKSGTRLIAAPYGYEGKLEIPDSVSYIDWHAFRNCTGITELVFPDSVVATAYSADVPTNLEKVTVGKGMTDWQGLYLYFDTAEIVISEDNPNYTVVDGSVYSKDMTKLLLCRCQEETYQIPEGVKEIADGAFRSPDTGESPIHRICIPASLETIPDGAFSSLSTLKAIEAADGNSNFASFDGLLYSKDGTRLLACPLGKTGTVTVREGTQEIAARAFYYGGNLMADTVIIPEGVTAIRSFNFSSTSYNLVFKLYLPASLTDIHPDMFEYAHEVEVHCPAGSAADTFAREAGVTVINE